MIEADENDEGSRQNRDGETHQDRRNINAFKNFNI